MHLIDRKREMNRAFALATVRATSTTRTYTSSLLLALSLDSYEEVQASWFLFFFFFDDDDGLAFES